LEHAVGLAVGDDGGGVVEEPIEHGDGGGVFGQEPSPVLEGVVGGDAEGAAFVGGGDEPERSCAPVSSRGANPISSMSTRSLRSRVSMTLPTVLSASPR
jgi:hypothetical protein